MVDCARGIDLRHPHPDGGSAGRVPGLDLVVQQGSPVGVDETQILAGILHLVVIDAAAVEHDQYRYVGQVSVAGGIVETEFLPVAPGGVEPFCPRRLAVQGGVLADRIAVVPGDRGIVHRVDGDIDRRRAAAPMAIVHPVSKAVVAGKVRIRRVVEGTIGVQDQVAV